jgi:hypothetical protein
VVLIVAGCADNPGERRGLGEPGTELADGFTVPEGAALIGTLFPGEATFYRRIPREERQGGDFYEEIPVDASWSAVLLVEDQPDKVVDRLADQAADLGYDERHRACVQGRGLVMCQVNLRRQERGFVRATLSLTTVRSVEAPEFAAHGVLTHRRLPARRVPVPPPPVAPARPTVPADVMAALPSVEPPPTPETGDVFGVPQAGSIRLAPGSRVVGPVRLWSRCTYGFLAVLEVAGELEPVLAYYRDQLRDQGLNVTLHEGDFRNRPLVSVNGSASGYGAIEFAFVVGGGQTPSYGRVEYCGD